MNDQDQALSENLPPEELRLESLINSAIRQAYLEHQRAGRPVVIERDGKIEWVDPAILLAERTGTER